MLLAIVFIVGALGQLSCGVPLESPSSDFSQFFDQRIVGGVEAKDQYPYMAALIAGLIWQSFVCGGSIITDRHVLTAAHCITSFIQWDGQLMSSFYAKVGSNIWDEGTQVVFKYYRIHPKYDSYLIKYDVGVLVAKKKIQLNERIATIGLNYDFVGGGEEVFLTGWGTLWFWGPIPDKLQKLYLKAMDPQECSDAVQAMVDQWNSWAPHVDPKIEICTFHSWGHGACHGDSGSPLVSKSNGLQTGVTAWAFPCAIGAPDVHVRVAGVRDFLEHAIKTH